MSEIHWTGDLTLAFPAGMADSPTTLVATGSWLGADLLCAEVTLERGVSTGWHYHDGPLVAAVRSGTLTQYDATGAAVVHRAGSCFVERAERDHVHVGVNLGVEPVELIVIYVIPAGAPLRVDVNPPAGVGALLLLL